jgi:hypothetical protein
MYFSLLEVTHGDLRVFQNMFNGLSFFMLRLYLM